ncbi:MAG: recombinase RecA [Actinomycetota bacterium]
MTADTYIWTDRGLETVEELFSRCGQPASCTSRITDIAALGVRAVNESGELEPIGALTHNNRKPVLRVRLGSGRTIKVTHNHPLRVIDENDFIVWRQAGRLTPDDMVVSAAFGAVEAASGDGIGEDEAVFLGYLIAEGTLSDRYRVSFTNWDPEVGEEFTRLAVSLFGAKVRCCYGKEYRFGDSALRSELAELYDLDHVTAHGKKIPSCIRTGGHKIQRAFLSALFEGDGWIDKSSTIGFASASERLAREVQLLLYGFGIPATVSVKRNPKYERDYWTVTITPAVAHRFLDEIGFRSSRRRVQVESNFRRSKHEPRFESLSHVEKYTFERVVAVEDAGIQPTFDLMMPKTHSFVANGILSHNTTVSLHVVAEAQKAGGLVSFIDAEHALDPTYAKAVGVNIDDLLVSQPDTGEQGLEIADTLVRSGAMDVIVIDSVAALVPRAEIEGEMGDSHVGLQARLMSQALRKLAGNVNRSKTILIFINQIREKIGITFGSNETTPGGRALKFYSSVRLDVRRIDALKDGAEIVGSRVRVKVVKNKVSAPFRKAEFDIQYGTGISKEGSLLDVAIEHEIVRKSGAWFIYGDDQLGQGRENAKTFLGENPDIATEIELKIKDKLGLLDQDSDGEDAPAEKG